MEETDKSSIVSAVLAVSEAVLSSFTSSVEHTKGSGVGAGYLGCNPGFTTAQMVGSGKVPQPLGAPFSYKSGIMVVQTSKVPARNNEVLLIKHSAQCLAPGQGSVKVSCHFTH